MVQALVDGELVGDALARLDAHLSVCGSCASLVADALEGALSEDAGSLSTELPNQLQERDDNSAGAMLPAIGSLLGDRYRIESLLGRGGMGTVYAARHLELGSRVAIKVLHLRDAPGRAARFLREARACARLANEHVSRVFDLGRLPNGAPYLVMEHLHGEDLARVVARGPVPPAFAIELVLQACSALLEAHACGIVHRDLKPANLFLTRRPDGTALLKVLDFGISKLVRSSITLERESLTASSIILGSPLYMSPEQLRDSSRVDARTDIWSLGVILYELLTGSPPFRGDSMSALAIIIATETPSRPSYLAPALSGALDALVLRCLSKDPADRFQTVEALMQALREAPEWNVRPGDATVQRNPSSPPLAPRPLASDEGADGVHVADSQQAFARQRRTMRMAYAVGLSLVGALAAVVALHERQAPSPTHATPAGAAAIGDAATLAASAEAPAEPMQTRQTLAVLGFQNLGASGGDDWLSTALTQLLNADLGGGTDLATVSAERVALARREVHLESLGRADAETLQRLQRNLGIDLVLYGTFLRTRPLAGRRRVSWQLFLKDLTSGDKLLSVVDEADEADLFQVSQRLSTRLRERLALEKPAADVLTGAHKTLPADPRAARLYAEGLREEYAMRFPAALAKLQAAEKFEPDAPMLQMALAYAHNRLNRDSDAKQHAERALKLSVGLSPENRMSIKARYHKIVSDWPQALEAYKALFAFYPDNIDYGLDLARAHTNSGQAGDALRVLQVLRAFPEPLGGDPRVDLEEARVTHGTSDYARCLEASQRVIARGRERGTWSSVAHAGYLLGLSLIYLDRPREALAELESASALARTYSDPGQVGLIATALAQVYSTRGRLADAQNALEAALPPLREAGNSYYTASVIEAQARIEREKGQFARAHRMVEREVIPPYRAVRRPHGLSTGLSHLASLEAESGSLDLAREHASEALRVSRGTGRKHAEWRAMIVLASLLRREGNLREARNADDAALAFARAHGSKLHVAQALEVIGERLLLEGDASLATTHLQEAETLRRSQDDLLGATTSRRLLLAALLAQGEADRVVVEGEALRQDLVGLGATTRALRVRVLEVRALMAAGRGSAALALSMSVHAAPETVGKDLFLTLLTARGAAHCAAGHVEKGEDMLREAVHGAEVDLFSERAGLAALSWRRHCRQDALRPAPGALSLSLKRAIENGYAAAADGSY